MALRKPPLKRFLELEAQMTAFATTRWRNGSASQFTKIREARADGDMPEATRMLSAIEMPPLSRGAQLQFKTLGLACLQFGAATVDPTLGLDWLARGADRTMLEHAMRQFGEFEQHVYPRIVGDAVLAAIAREEKALDASEVTQKADLKQINWDGVDISAENGGRNISAISANLTTSRLVNYGALDAMSQRNITRYRIQAVLDRRTSLICRHMHGKTFVVAEGVRRLEDALVADNVNDLKVLHPWIPGSRAGALASMSGADLTAAGWNVPPYHPRCRSICVASDESLDDVADDFEIEAENADWYSTTMAAIAALLGVQAR